MLFGAGYGALSTDFKSNHRPQAISLRDLTLGLSEHEIL